MLIRTLLVEAPEGACHVDVSFNVKDIWVTTEGHKGYKLSDGCIKGYLPRRVDLMNFPSLGTDTFVVTQQSVGTGFGFVLQHYRNNPVLDAGGTPQLLQVIPLPEKDDDVNVGDESTPKLRLGSFYGEPTVVVNSPYGTYVMACQGIREFLTEKRGLIHRGFRRQRNITEVDYPEMSLEQWLNSLCESHEQPHFHTAEPEKRDGVGAYQQTQELDLTLHANEPLAERDLYSEMRQLSNIHIREGLTYTTKPMDFGCEYITIFYDDGGVIGSVVLPIDRFKNGYRYHLDYQGGQRLEVHTSIDHAVARVTDEMDDSEGTDEYVLALVGNPEVISVQWLNPFGNISPSELKISWSTETYPVGTVKLDNGGTVISIYETGETGEQKVSSAVLPLMTKSPHMQRLHFNSQQRELVLMDEDHPYSKDRRVFDLVTIA